MTTCSFPFSIHCRNVPSANALPVAASRITGNPWAPPSNFVHSIAPTGTLAARTAEMATQASTSSSFVRISSTEASRLPVTAGVTHAFVHRKDFGLCCRAMRSRCAIAAVALLLAGASTRAATYPAPVEGDYIVRNFKFASGETLPELRLHYRTIGTPLKDASGVISNAVLLLHGTSGTGANFLVPDFAGQLFEQGQL